MIIKTAIIEDELAGQELLKKYISEHFPECFIVSVSENVTNAIKDLEILQPHLVFLDIHLKGGTGFDVLKKLTHRTFELIFVTAYDQFAIAAIRAEAIDYLLKPINLSEFINGTHRAILKIKQAQAQPNSNQILPINTMTGIEFIEFENISFLEAEGAYTNIYHKAGKTLSTKNIGEYEVILSGNMFYRTHHSFIVNLKNIKKFEKGRSGILVLDTEHKIPVSQRKMKEFTAIIDGYNLR